MLTRKYIGRTAAGLPIGIMPTAAQQWPSYGGDTAGSKYSSLDQINRSSVAGLKLAWEWKTGEVPFPQFNTTPGPFEGTPLMIDGALYLPTPYNRVVALEAETGRQLWSYDPKLIRAVPTQTPGMPIAESRPGGTATNFESF